MYHLEMSINMNAFFFPPSVAHKSKKHSTKRNKWPQRDDNKRDECQIAANERQNCDAWWKIECQWKGCCWEDDKSQYIKCLASSFH